MSTSTPFPPALQPLSEAALHYARRGIPVFPCEPGGKRPLTAHGFKDASADPETVKAWWRSYPNASIGMPTGEASGIEIVDIDVKRGENGLKALISALGRGGTSIPELETCAACSTPSGGTHFWLKWDGSERRRSRANVLPGVDLRSAGGYAIVPPSPGYIGNSLSAGTWTESLKRIFRSCRSGPGASGLPASTPPEFALPPDRLRELLETLPPERVESYTPWIETGMAVHHATGGSETGLEIWDAWSQGSVFGKYPGPNVLRDKWLSFGRERGNAQPVTLRSLTKAGLSAADGGTLGEAKHAELLAALKTQLAAEDFRNAGPPSPSFRKGNGEAAAYPSPSPPAAATGLEAGVSSGWTEDAAKIPGRDWLDPRKLWLRGETAALAGRAGVSKSTLMLGLVCDWIAAQAAEKKKGTAVWLSADDDLLTARRRVAAWRLHRGSTGEELEGRLHVLTLEHGLGGLNLSSEAGLDRLAREVAARQADLLVVDPLANLSGLTDENSNAQMARLGMGLKALALKCACAVVLLHHVRKGAAGNGGAPPATGGTGGRAGVKSAAVSDEDMRGASALIGTVRSVRTLRDATPEEAETLGGPGAGADAWRWKVLEHAKANYSGMEDTRYFRIETPTVGAGGESEPVLSETAGIAIKGASAPVTATEVQTLLNAVASYIADNGGTLAGEFHQAGSRYIGRIAETCLRGRDAAGRRKIAEACLDSRLLVREAFTTAGRHTREGLRPAPGAISPGSGTPSPAVLERFPPATAAGDPE